MRDILDEIVANKRLELVEQKKVVPPSMLFAKVESMISDGTVHTIRSMSHSLVLSDTGIIAEFKRKSPSKGWIKQEGCADIIPASYNLNGASAVSILTDEKFFGGDLSFIVKARNNVNCPILRKDFIVDEYQLYQARLVGADAVLLIAADLSKDECKLLARKSHQLGLETLLEVHGESELDYICDDIDMVGVNNRNLGTFHTDVSNSFKLASILPDDFVLVSESGISDPLTILELRKLGFKGFLIGETFMRTDDPGAALYSFVKQIQNTK